jgi:tRNA threonylcarbamoyladenosine modification (KEOPS) complex Cgi121 subunit
MRFHLEEYGKTVEVTGYRGIWFETAETYLKTNRKHPQNVEIQFFDADLTATPQHLYFAALNAIEAFSQKTNISKTLAMETMLFASAQGQIQKAIQQAGINAETKNMAVIIIGDNSKQVDLALELVTKAVDAPQDETVLDLTEDKIVKIKKAFAISDRELQSATRGKSLEEAIAALVIERMALVSTQL